MTVHDWTRVDDATFHDFHLRWIAHLTDALNTGVLPDRFYARSEQHYGEHISDILTLHESRPTTNGVGTPADSDHATGAVAVAEAPPKVGTHRMLVPSLRALRRTIAVRNARTDVIVAVIEIVSPANKDRRDSAMEFAHKIASTLRRVFMLS